MLYLLYLIGYMSKGVENMSEKILIIDDEQEMCIRDSFTEWKRRQHMSVILETRQLCKFYGAGENQVKAVNQVDIQIEQGESVSYTHLDVYKRQK